MVAVDIARCSLIVSPFIIIANIKERSNWRNPSTVHAVSNKKMRDTFTFI